LSP
jgi:cold shock CspA family protein